MSLPDDINTAVSDAILYLIDVLNYEILEADTHRTLVITGWNDNDNTRRAIANYLIGLRACAIDAALTIRAQLEDTAEDRIDIKQSVYDIVGESEDSLTDDQKTDERNPWIAEGIWHLCMIIAYYGKPEFHPVGTILALHYPHIGAKDHGLDVATIYESEDQFGLTLIETKAYKNDPNAAINNAVDFFREVDKGKHGARIRQSVQLMRKALPQTQQDKIRESFWRGNRSYCCNPHYDANCCIDWTNSRPSFDTLKLGRQNKLIMPHKVSGFDDFFNKIAEEMRSVVESL